MSSKSKKEKKKAKAQVKKYYGEKKTDVTTKATTDTKRLQEDLQRILNESGVQQTRATEDYVRNIGNIEANKKLDVDQLADYVKTNSTRTQEDLDTSLAKEARRFSLESDQVNQSLAERGRTFSDRTEEKIIQAEDKQTVADISQVAARSFNDISRYEAAKNAEVQLKYGQQTEAAGVEKKRSIEDILNEQQTKETQISRGGEDIAFGKATDIRDLDYSENDALSNIENFYDVQNNALKTQKKLLKVTG